MSGFIKGVDRNQATLLPDRLEDWIGEDRLVKVIALFMGELNRADPGFTRASHAQTGRPGSVASC